MMNAQQANGTVLVTGFEGFGGSHINSTARLVALAQGVQVEQYTVIGLELPVSQHLAARKLEEAVEQCQPSLVLSLGLANGRSKLALERVAINVLDYPIPDNDGAQPITGSIVQTGPPAYFATLPIKSILARWLETDIPGYISNTAGTFLCNQLMYQSLHLGALHGYRAGFIHVPCLPEQAAQLGDEMPSMTLELMFSAVMSALTVAIRTTEDIALASGVMA